MAVQFLMGEDHGVIVSTLYGCLSISKTCKTELAGKGNYTRDLVNRKSVNK